MRGGNKLHADGNITLLGGIYFYFYASPSSPYSTNAYSERPILLILLRSTKKELSSIGRG